MIKSSNQGETSLRFQKNLHQGVSKQKVQKFLPVLEGNVSVKYAPKISAKYLLDKYAKSIKCKKLH